MNRYRSEQCSLRKMAKALYMSYANEDSLLDEEKIELYHSLVNDPVLHDFVVGSIETLRRKLLNENNVSCLRYMKERLNVEVFVPDPIPKRPLKNLYSDPENVHEFVKDTLRVAKRLVETYPSEYKRPFDHVFFNRFETETYQNGQVDLKALVASVVRFIDESPYSEELRRRLVEEVNESEGKCLTGHVCRLINVIRGFDDRFDASLSNYEYYKDSAFAEISEKADAFELDGLLERIRMLVNDKTIRLKKKFALKILRDYTKRVWTESNGIYDYE